MKRPKKQETRTNSEFDWGYDEGYNQAIKDWEAYLPSEKEIIKILRDNIDCEYHHRYQIKQTAKAISKRIKG